MLLTKGTIEMDFLFFFFGLTKIINLLRPFLLRLEGVVATIYTSDLL